MENKDENGIIPLFTSEYSIGRSILTIEEAGEITDDAPVSITSIAKKHNIAPVYLVESSLDGFVKAYKHFEEIKTQFIYGIRLVVVNDMNEKTAESCNNECKVIVFFNNSNAYADGLKLYSLAATEGKYYVPRIDWKSLKKMWTKNLSLAIPFYDSFLHTNLLTIGSCIPDFPDTPVFFMEDHDLPIDGLLSEAILKYCIPNSIEIKQTHSCLYYKTLDVTAFQTFKCLHQRTSLAMPNLNDFGSDRFSFESYLELIGRKLD